MVVPEASINNIMGGLETSAGIRLHNHRRKLKQRFDIVRKLGQGTYGKVQLGINKETGQEVAIKTIKKCKIETEADLIRIRREIQIMSSVQHPNIIHIYEVFENREKMVLVMEYAAGGELYDYISEKKVLNEAEARRIFRQIATAVYYCHKHKICHRDLKLENVLLDEHGSAKIADFGLSNVFDETHLLGTFCGSPLYASPEIVKGTPYHGPEVDCWSLGVLLYTLVYGSMPFDGSNFKRLVRQISQGDYFEPKKPSPASPLIAEMLKVNAARRADIVAICSHWWVDHNEQVACMAVAEELANQTPVRLDLLLSLAPSACAADKLLIPEQGTLEEEASPVSDCPVRSQSLGSLAVISQPIDFLAEEAQRSKRTSETKPEGATTDRREKRSKSKRRERSSSRSRKRDESTPESDSYTERPHRKSTKSKKKQQDESKKQEEPKKPAMEECLPEVPALDEKPADNEVVRMEEDETVGGESTLKTSEVEEILKSIKQIEKDCVADYVKVEVGDKSLDAFKQEVNVVEDRKESVEVDDSKVKDTVEKETKDEVKDESNEQKVVKRNDSKKELKKADKVDEEKPVKLMERRKSKIFETAEKFSNLQEPVKPPPKKVFLPGVKVSDAKKAYERKSSLASSSSFVKPLTISRRNSSAEPTSPTASDYDRKFSLASTVALNKLVEDVEKLARDEDEKKKKENEKKQDTKVDVAPEVVEDKVVKKVDEESEVVEVEGDSSQVDKVVDEKSTIDKVISDAKTVSADVKEKSVSPPGDAKQVKKIENAVKVISNAIDTNGADTKAATLPRRKTSRAEIKLATPKLAKPEFRSEVEHMVAAAPATASVQRAEVVFPVAAAAVPVRSATLPPSPQQLRKPPQPATAKPDSCASPRERIIPIRFESDDKPATAKAAPAAAATPPPAAAAVAQPAAAAPSGQRPVSRANSQSLSRQSTADSDSGSIVGQGEPIRKSPREVIIPIAVEGGGYVTPNLEAVSKISSLTESEDESSAHAHGFGLHSSRRPKKQLETADSVSSDEDDDNFEILTAESLFSALLSKVRNLTHRLNTEETRPPGFPRLFNHHSLFENSPSFSSRRLSEARSFSRPDVPWRRSMSRDSSSTLPRDFSRSSVRHSMLPTRSNDSGSSLSSKLPRRSPSLHLTGDKPPLYRQKLFSRTIPEPTNDVNDNGGGATKSDSLDVRNKERASSKSPRQSIVREDSGKRNLSSYLEDRQSMIREVIDETRRKSPYSFDERQRSSNSDLSESYKTAKNSRSVSVERNEFGISGKLFGEKLKNSYSDMSEVSQSSDSKSFSLSSKHGDDALERHGIKNNSQGQVLRRQSSLAQPIRVRKSSFIDAATRRTDTEGTKNDYRGGSYLTDRRRFSYIDGASNYPSSYSTAPRVTESLRMRRHSKESAPPLSSSMSDRISAKDIEKFRSEFKKSNINETLKARSNKNDNSIDLPQNNNLMDVPQNNTSDGFEKTLNSGEETPMINNSVDNLNNGSGSDTCVNGGSNIDDSNRNTEDVCNNNMRMTAKNINDVVTFTKPDSPLLYTMKETNYQSPLTNRQFSARRKSYISSVLDRDDSNLLRKNSDKIMTERNGVVPDFQRSISLKQGEEIRTAVGRGFRRSQSVTPDRSVLGKFLESEKIDPGSSEDVDDRIQTRHRRVSRFLRPDFYDTPREESVYVKKNEEKLKSDVKVKSKDSLKKKTSRVKDTIRVLRESSLPKECDIAISESSLIKRAVSLDDCSVVGIKPKPRSKRASSVSSDRIIFEPLAKIESFIKKKMSSEKKKKKIVNRDEKTDVENVESVSKTSTESVLTKLSRKLSPKGLKSNRRKSCIEVISDNDFKVNVMNNHGNGYRVDKSNSLEVSSRATRIANLKKLDFTKPHHSADSTPSCEDFFDDSSLILLSPNEDNSDSWSASSDYVDARDFSISPTVHASSGAEESVSERIRRKSFYSRFNQLKKKKTPPSSSASSGQVGIMSPRMSSRLPTYRRSISSSLPSSNVHEQQVDK